MDESPQKWEKEERKNEDEEKKERRKKKKGGGKGKKKGRKQGNEVGMQIYINNQPSNEDFIFEGEKKNPFVYKPNVAQNKNEEKNNECVKDDKGSNIHQHQPQSFSSAKTKNVCYISANKQNFQLSRYK
jgi:hypothetical protein